jgi:hypothetical protein
MRQRRGGVGQGIDAGIDQYNFESVQRCLGKMQLLKRCPAGFVVMVMEI